MHNAWVCIQCCATMRGTEDAAQIRRTSSNHGTTLCPPVMALKANWHT
jgi:hypothetical protein